MIIGIDQSLRSSGVTAVSSSGDLLGFKLICPPKHLDGVELLAYIWDELCGFIDKMILEYPEHPIQGVVFEGLSFNSSSGTKDLLWGLQWVLRYLVYDIYNDQIPVGVIAVMSWRSWVLSKEERKLLKGKELKKAVVDKLPFEVRARFEEYIRIRGLKKECLEDLADSYFLSLYRLSLETK